MAVKELRAILKKRFGGVLRHGSHVENGQACALECVSAPPKIKWTDRPEVVGMPDLRPLNDARWPDDATRTKHMLPVIEALWNWADWSNARKILFAERLAFLTITEMLPVVLRTIKLEKE